MICFRELQADFAAGRALRCARVVVRSASIDRIYLDMTETAPKIGMNEDVYTVLHDNLVAVKPEYATREVVLCPICLREIPRDIVLKFGVEHIIPQNVIRNDEPDFARLGTKNQRCGITVLCREPRICASDGKTSPDGCNGMKGRLYDRLFRGLFDSAAHRPEELQHGHGIAILIMAYLGAFQNLGYEYILRPTLDDIRTQFDFPNEQKTEWAQFAKYYLGESETQIVATSTGQPFVWGGQCTTGAPLHIFFRRCRALLPGGHWKLKALTRHLGSLLPEEIAQHRASV